MRSLFLSLILGLGAVGLSLGSPTQVRADEFRNPAFTRGNTTTQVAWHRGWGGRSHYYGGYGGYGYYPYGGWYGGRSYYPGFYGGYSPWGGYGGWGGYYAPYSGYYYRPGFYW